MGLFGSGPLGIRLFLVFLLPLLFGVVMVVMVLRALALARPGMVRAGFGGGWIAVNSPEEITIEDGIGRWPQICAIENRKRHPLITTPGPLWLGSHGRHKRALESARGVLVHSAFAEAPPHIAQD